jgi:hypothetical protein
MDPSKEETYREEAERLAQLPRDDQAAVVAMYRRLSADPLATKACRAEAERKAEALAVLLGLEGHGKPAKATEGRNAEASSVKGRAKRRTKKGRNP